MDVRAEIGRETAANHATPLDYEAPDSTTKLLGRRAKSLIKWAVATLCLFVLAAAVLPMFTRTHRGTPASTVRCMANVRQILMACQLYAGSNGGQYPTRLDDLIVPYQLSGSIFICPLSKDPPATGPTPQSRQSMFAQGGHCSYVYTGSGLTSRSPAKTLVIYEARPNHNGLMIVGFADGRVTALTAAERQQLLALVAATKGPVTWPPATSQPATTPSPR
jgi:hypothetical protein